MATIIDSVIILVVIMRIHVCTEATPLAMITTRKSIHGFPLLCYIGMGLYLAALSAAGALL